MLFPSITQLVAEEQDPEKTNVPNSVVLNTNEGLVSFVGVGIGVISFRMGAILSIRSTLAVADHVLPTKSENVNVKLPLPVSV